MSIPIAIDTLDLPVLLALRLVDEFTGRPPLAPPLLRADLVDDDDGSLRPTDAKALVTANGIVTFPALRAPAAGRTDHYRIGITPGPLRPLLWDGPVEFTVDQPAGAAGVPAVRIVTLRPGPTYPFPSHVLVVRGLVQRAGVPVADAAVEVVVTDSPRRERGLTDERGAFGVGVRWFDPTTAFTVVVTTRDGDHQQQRLLPAEAFAAPVLLNL